MADPVFQMRDELEAWAVKTVREANAHFILGERTARIDALKIIQRVTLAHMHLPFKGTPNNPA